MEKRPPKPAPEPVQKKEDTTEKLASVLKEQGEFNLLAMEVAKILTEKLESESAGNKAAIQAMIEKLTATRQIDAEVTSRDSGGNIKTLRIISRAATPTLH